ncbi:hypothetical protein FXF51_26450 [Nonomuraea sp. PA05]|uniref:hypothetical protein n=1 Tax=Nonomuraea sp. PA05 TaxID=2604466 RepID=UPI0011D3493A|nr:hypothetical protein [Nonomuraea sp. PA05]TYB62253.1 hypothetical protein FXF51_26450 [Nonomuraea sp. PA05]
MTDADNVAPSRTKQRIAQWFSRVFLALVAVAITLGMIDKRGVAMGVLAALTYGALAATVWVPFQRLMDWSRRHPMLDGLCFAPILLCGLAYLTSLSLLWCLGIAVIGTALLLAVVGWRRGLLR